MIDERIAKMMEAWDFGQFSDIKGLPEGMAHVLFDGLKAVQEHTYGPRNPVFNYDLAAAPKGTLQLLTEGMTRRIGEVSSVASAKAQGVIAWAPVADRDRSEEIRLGHISPPRNRL